MSSSRRVVVAMSGGVDSSVAALLLHQQGYSIIGVSMQVWDYRQNGGSCSRASCCAPSDFNDARRVAGRLGVPYYVFDFEHDFKRTVIDRFIGDYRSGLTPNPCVECNNKVKFGMLRERASQMGFGVVATGHYARVVRDSSGWRLLRGVDRNKDQSYFLSGMKSSELEGTLFPIGDLEKSAVRELARQAEFSTADKPESQDICFVSGRAGDFVERIGAFKAHGVVQDRSGQVIGRHDGVHNFTVGQRRGLGINGGDDPLYVVELDAANQIVVVGAKQDLQREGFSVVELNIVSPALEQRLAQLPRGGSLEIDGVAQLRHRHAGVPVRVQIYPSFRRAKASFVSTWGVVSPGQTISLYNSDNEELLAGGKIAPLDHSFPADSVVCSAAAD